MTEQHLIIEDYGWEVFIFYQPDKDDIDGISSVLEMVGCPEENIRKAEENMLLVNTGFTYSNYTERASVMVIGRTTSLAELWSTVDHEKGHLVQHISEAFGLDEYGEAREYLAGDIACGMYPYIRVMLCPCSYKDRP